MKLLTVKHIYDKLNATNFGGVLDMPVIMFSRMRKDHGKYNGISMIFNLADTKGIPAVTELVYHEMIHQYIDQFLELECDDDHGKEFKKQYNKFSYNVEIDKAYKYE